MKSGSDQSFYAPGEAPGSFLSTPATAGPWSPDAQHGSPPSALLTRALTASIPPDLTLARISVDLLGPVPVGPLSVAVSVLRPGARVQLLEARLYDVAAGRECAVARAWALPRAAAGPGSVTPLPHEATDGAEVVPPPSWSCGYLDAMEWRWIKGSVQEAGPAVVWMRPRIPLLSGEPLAGAARLMACVDSASGISAALDPTKWGFMNTDLSVTIVREPVGEWICVEAETALAPTAVGVATSNVYDELGLVAHTSQTLLIQRHR